MNPHVTLCFVLYIDDSEQHKTSSYGGSNGWTGIRPKRASNSPQCPLFSRAIPNQEESSPVGGRQPLPVCSIGPWWPVSLLIILVLTKTWQSKLNSCWCTFRVLPEIQCNLILGHGQLRYRLPHALLLSLVSFHTKYWGVFITVLS